MLEELIEKINTMEENIQMLLDLHLQQSNNLTTYSDVAKFLGRCKKTVRNYIKDGKLINGIHYFINADGKTVFIPNGIIEFKKGVRAVETKAILQQADKVIGTRVNNPVVNDMLKGIAS